MTEDEILQRIDEGSREKDREQRAYLGASMIGDDCEVRLQMGLRGYPKDEFDPRILRIFALGHIIEDIVVADLKKAGFHVMEKDDFTNRQWEWKDAGGHIKAHADGLIDLGLGRLSLLEIKSMNNKKHTEFIKKGIKSANKRYFEQMQMMMGMGRLKEALFIAYNKDTSAYHCEIVEYDEFVFSFIKNKITRAMEGAKQRTSDDPTRFVCRFCDAKKYCWSDEHDEDIPQICRTCDHSRPTFSGDWHCTLHNKSCNQPCDRWSKIKIEPGI